MRECRYHQRTLQENGGKKMCLFFHQRLQSLASGMQGYEGQEGLESLDSLDRGLGVNGKHEHVIGRHRFRKARQLTAAQDTNPHSACYGPSDMRSSRCSMESLQAGTNRAGADWVRHPRHDHDHQSSPGCF